MIIQPNITIKILLSLETWSFCQMTDFLLLFLYFPFDKVVKGVVIEAISVQIMPLVLTNVHLKGRASLKIMNIFSVTRGIRGALFLICFSRFHLITYIDCVAFNTLYRIFKVIGLNRKKLTAHIIKCSYIFSHNRCWKGLSL